MSNERDYKKDIEIDPNNLEQEWIEQPSLFLHYSDAYAEASFQRDKKKAFLDYTYSKLYAQIKSDWSEHFDSKPTEPACKEWIVRHEDYRKAEKSFILAQKNANILLNVKTAFDQRKHALSNLTSLKIGGFYSEPRNKKRDVENMKNAQRRTLRRTKR
jgi:hypothetical protein